MVLSIPPVEVFFLIGFHAMAGTPGGLLTHTYTLDIVSIHLNGCAVGEIGMECALAGSFGLPTALVTGDSKAIEEAENLLGDVESAIVKQSLGETAASCLPPAVSCKLIREKAARAVDRRGEFRPFRVTEPVELHVEDHSPELCPCLPSDVAFEKPDEKSIVIKAPNIVVAWQILSRTF